MEDYKGIKSNFKKLDEFKLEHGKNLVISKKINPATKEESISIAIYVKVTGENGKPMKIFLKNAINLDSEQSKKIAMVLLNNC